MTMRWRNVEVVKRNMDLYKEQVRQAVVAVAQFFSVQLENYAKTNARWTDRSGNARQGLYSLVDDAAENAVIIYLSHGVDYGKWLEIAFQGRFAIIWEAIESNIEELRSMLQGIFR